MYKEQAFTPDFLLPPYLPRNWQLQNPRVRAKLWNQLRFIFDPQEYVAAKLVQASSSSLAGILYGYIEKAVKDPYRWELRKTDFRKDIDEVLEHDGNKLGQQIEYRAYINHAKGIAKTKVKKIFEHNIEDLLDTLAENFAGAIGTGITAKDLAYRLKWLPEEKAKEFIELYKKNKKEIQHEKTEQQKLDVKKHKEDNKTKADRLARKKTALVALIREYIELYEDKKVSVEQDMKNYSYQIKTKNSLEDLLEKIDDEIRGCKKIQDEIPKNNDQLFQNSKFDSLDISEVSNRLERKWRHIVDEHNRIIGAHAEYDSESTMTPALRARTALRNQQARPAEKKAKVKDPFEKVIDVEPVYESQENSKPEVKPKQSSEKKTPVTPTNIPTSVQDFPVGKPLKKKMPSGVSFDPGSTPIEEDKPEHVQALDDLLEKAKKIFKDLKSINITETNTVYKKDEGAAPVVTKEAQDWSNDVKEAIQNHPEIQSLGGFSVLEDWQKVLEDERKKVQMALDGVTEEPTPTPTPMPVDNVTDFPAPPKKTRVAKVKNKEKSTPKAQADAYLTKLNSIWNESENQLKVSDDSDIEKAYNIVTGINSEWLDKVKGKNVVSETKKKIEKIEQQAEKVFRATIPHMIISFNNEFNADGSLKSPNKVKDILDDYNKFKNQINRFSLGNSVGVKELNRKMQNLDKMSESQVASASERLLASTLMLCKDQVTANTELIQDSKAALELSFLLKEIEKAKKAYIKELKVDPHKHEIVKAKMVKKIDNIFLKYTTTDVLKDHYYKKLKYKVLNDINQETDSYLDKVQEPEGMTPMDVMRSAFEKTEARLIAACKILEA